MELQNFKSNTGKGNKFNPMRIIRRGTPHDIHKVRSEDKRRPIPSNAKKRFRITKHMGKINVKVPTIFEQHDVVGMPIPYAKRIGGNRIRSHGRRKTSETCRLL